MTKTTRARKLKNGYKTFKKYAIPAGAALATAAAIYADHHISKNMTAGDKRLREHYAKQRMRSFH